MKWLHLGGVAGLSNTANGLAAFKVAGRPKLG